MEAGTADPGKVIVDVTEGRLWAAPPWPGSLATPGDVSLQATESDRLPNCICFCLGQTEDMKLSLSAFYPSPFPLDCGGLGPEPRIPRGN